MNTLRVILGDQLSSCLEIVKEANAASDVFLMCELKEEATYVKHHQQKIALVFCAMRQFAQELKNAGFRVRYVYFDDPNNTGTFEGEIARALQTLENFNAQTIAITEPGEWRLLSKIKTWQTQFKLHVHIVTDTRFLCSIAEFNAWAANKKQWRMEFFYREMRKKYRLLLEPNGEPIGGKWNFDHDNRAAPPSQHVYPNRFRHVHNEQTQAVIALVKTHFADHFGSLAHFNYAISREQALEELDFFIEHCLAHFGTWQDAMVIDEPYLYHSRLSAYLNLGLLQSLELCEKAQAAYFNQQAPLNAVEGFIRQVLGWREFVRGIYWRFMPEYGALNYFETQEPLPDFYWSGNTHMRCVAQAVKDTQQYAYSHHIQRLMITGNFALLAGLDVKAVQDWYLAVYNDAYEWVEMPNTLGMALYGDGGIVGSKPYAASGKYIDRMSNFCKGCRYQPDQTLGDKACPFNALYWDFVARNESKLSKNQRMTYVYATWRRFDAPKQIAIREQAKAHIHNMRNNEL